MWEQYQRPRIRKTVSLHERWVETLLTPDLELKGENSEVVDLCHQIDAWRDPIFSLRPESEEEPTILTLSSDGEDFWAGRELSGDFLGPVEAPLNPAVILRRVQGRGMAAAARHIPALKLGDTFPACRLWPRIIFGNAGQNHRGTVGKLGDQRKIPAHRLNGLSESGQQEIAPLFKARNTVLGDPERLGHLYLRELARVPQFAQGHFLGNQLSRAGLDLLALRWAQFLHFVLQRDWHDYVPCFFVRERRSSNLSSAFAMSWR